MGNKTHKLLEGLKCPKCNCPTQLKILKMKPLSILIQNFVGDRVGAVTRVVRSKILKIKGGV